MNLRSCLTAFCANAILFNALFAEEEAPANSELVVNQTFASSELDGKWHINTGKWVVQDQVLRASEVSSEKHSAAARLAVETKNAVYQLRFRFVGNGQAFHFGFDPAPGELEKRGHLFSLIITPTSWKLMKHVDKKRRTEDPNEVLAEEKLEFEKDRWYTLRLTTWENYVSASIDGEHGLKASHPTFAVLKPTLVFRCLGDGIEIDDIKVWKQVN